MKSQVAKHSMVIRGHKTSISLEGAFWNSLREIAQARGKTVSQLVASIDAERKSANLSSNLRVFVLGFYQDQFAASISISPARASELASSG